MENKKKIERFIDLIVALERYPRKVVLSVNKNEYKKYMLNKITGEKRCIICDRIFHIWETPESNLVCENCLYNSNFIDKLKVRGQ